jgi:hypothetical protein
MGLHNFHICSEQLVTSNYIKDNGTFFSFCCNFSNVRLNRPWIKNKKPKAWEMENKFQVDKSKAKEEIDENVIVLEN